MENKKRFTVIGILLIILISPTTPLFNEFTGGSSLQAPLNTLIFENDEMFDLFIALLVSLSHTPSMSACIIKDNEVIWAKGYGIYDIEHDKAATEETAYMIASISKTITATALMQLYEQGLFQLDDDVNAYLPFSVRNPYYPDEPITFRMFLSHHSSLAEEPPEFYRYYIGDCPIPLYPWLETYLVPGGNNYTSKVWSDDHPGTTFHYSNVGFALIGYLVERLSGIPFDRYCKDNIFMPLIMLNTSYRLQDIDIDTLAVPYTFKFGEHIPYQHFGYIEYPAGSVRTSVTELAHFVIAHMNNGVYNGTRILENTTVALMHTAQYPDGTYGLGWFVKTALNGEHLVGHTGGDIGVTTNLDMRLSDNVAIMYLTNGSPHRPLEVLAWRLIETILFMKADR